jgi:hypothetical protein
VPTEIAHFGAPSSLPSSGLLTYTIPKKKNDLKLQLKQISQNSSSSKSHPYSLGKKIGKVSDQLSILHDSLHELSSSQFVEVGFRVGFRV